MRMLVSIPIRLLVMVIAGANMLIGAPGINAFAQSLTDLASRIESGGQAGHGNTYPGAPGYVQKRRSLNPVWILLAVIAIVVVLCCCGFQILMMNSGYDRECGINPC